MHVISCSQSKLLLFLATAGCLLFSTPAPAAAQGPDCAKQELGTLLAIVTDKTTRAPLTGAVVSAGWAAVRHRTSARTDSAGRGILCVPLRQAISLRASYAEINAPPAEFSQTGPISRHAISIDVPGSLVRGRVIDRQSGGALPGVVVRLAGARMSAMTDSAGRFHFERVPMGSYQLHAEHIAYARNTTAVQVGHDDLDALVPLTPDAIALPPIVVSVFSRRLEHVGFYARQKRGVGLFIDRKQIDAMNVQDASDLLRRIPSLRLVPLSRRTSAAPHRNATVGRRGNCRFTFIVDGTRTLPDFEMDFVAPHALEGIEVYSGLAEVPASFNAHASSASGSGSCGVIAIWTRNSR